MTDVTGCCSDIRAKNCCSCLKASMKPWSSFLLVMHKERSQSKASATENKDPEQEQLFGRLLEEQLQRVQRSTKEWHPLIIKWCLSVANKSIEAYEALRSSGFLKLPHLSTLQRYIRVVQQHRGTALMPPTTDAFAGWHAMMATCTQVRHNLDAWY